MSDFYFWFLISDLKTLSTHRDKPPSLSAETWLVRFVALLFCPGHDDDYDGGGDGYDDDDYDDHLDDHHLYDQVKSSDSELCY